MVQLVIMLNNHAFIFASLASGLILLLIAGCARSSDSVEPMQIIGSTNVEQFVRAGAATDDHLMLVSSAGQDDQVALRVFDMNESAKIQEVGSLTAPGAGHNFTFATTSGIALSDDLAYIPLGGSDQPGLWIVDVSDPESPDELAWLPLLDTVPQSVAIDGDMAVVSGLLGSKTYLVDVSDSGNPQIAGELSYSATSATHVDIDSDLVFVSDFSGIAVFDVSSPDSPEEVGFYENVNWTGPATGDGNEGSTSFSTQESTVSVTPDIAVVGDVLYVANGDSGLEVLSLTNPNNPDRVAQVDFDLRAIDLTVSDDNVYLLARGVLEPGVSDLPYVLQRLDVSQPDIPEVVDELTDFSGGIPSPFQSLVAGEDQLYFLNSFRVDVVAT